MKNPSLQRQLMHYCAYLVLAAVTALMPIVARGTPHWDVSAPGLDPNLASAPFHTPMVAKDGALYAAIHVNQYGNSFVMRWTKCNGWELIGELFTSDQAGPWVHTMYLSGDNLYIGGHFITPVVGAAATNIAKCNLLTGAWSIVGNNTITDEVYAVAVDVNGKIYVGAGSSGDHGAATQSHLLKTWSGSAWVTVGGGMVGSSSEEYGVGRITALAADGTNIYVGGIFDAGINPNSSRVNSDNIIKWTGATWQAMGTGIHVDTFWEAINKIVVSGTNVFVAGSFATYDESGPIAPTGLVRFSTNGSHAQSYNLRYLWYNYEVGYGYDRGMGFDLSAQNGTVYLAGDFDHIDSTELKGFAKWTNGTWSTIGSGVSRSDEDPEAFIRVIGRNAVADANASTPRNAIYVNAVRPAEAAALGHYEGTFDLAGGVGVVNGPLIRWVLGSDDDCSSLEKRISAGGSHSLAVKFDGTVWAWGYNAHGQLGDGTTTTRTSPVQVSGISQIIAIAAGGDFSLALKSDGTVWAWGRNDFGQLGDGTTTSRTTPVQVANLSGVVAIDAGYHHTLALTGSGLYSWGYNNYGQLGDGTTTTRTSPVQVSNGTGLYGYNVSEISAGFYHSLAVVNGIVWAWGLGANGQLGDGMLSDSSSPVEIPDWLLSNVSKISAGGWHSLALDSAGNVFAWGENSNGQLGVGGTWDASIPNQVIFSYDVTAISGGIYHSMALKSDGTVRAWGRNNFGQIGDGTTTDRTSPVQVSGLSGMTAISGGGYFSLSTGSISAIKSWGANHFGQLGNGTFSASSTPVTVTGFGF